MGIFSKLTRQDLFRTTKEEWLDGARTVAVRLLRNRNHITIDDVLEHYEFPEYLNRNLIGSVFQDRRFIKDGYTNSRRKVTHGHVIAKWSLTDHVIAVQELDCE